MGSQGRRNREKVITAVSRIILKPFSSNMMRISRGLKNFIEKQD